MTQEDTAKALKLLADTEAITGTDLSTVRWAVQRQAEVKNESREDDATSSVQEVER